MIPFHGIGSRQDLPLPFEFVLAGAAIAVAASFVVLLLAWRRSRWDRAGGVPLPRLTRFVDHPVVNRTARLAVFGLFAWSGFALLWGQDRLTNPVFGFVFVWMWVGLVPVSLVGGAVWRELNPLRTLAAASGVVPAVRRRGIHRGLVHLPWSRIGVWPAAAGLLGFTWLELVQPGNTTLGVLRVWAAVWVIGAVVGAALFGRAWIAAADPFEAFATLVSRLSPWQRIGGVIHLVNPVRNSATFRPPAGTLAVVGVLLGSTAFDSFGSTTWWIRTTQTSSAPGWMWGSAGLIGFVTLVAGLFALATRTLRASPGRGGVARRLSPSLIPLVVGYSIGHYFSLLVIEGQRTAIQLSDPLGRGWNVFGTAELGINTWLFEQPTFTALVQLAAIVGGHVLGIVVGHELVLRRPPPDRPILRQVPLVAVMVCFTVGGLVLLFSP